MDAVDTQFGSVFRTVQAHQAGVFGPGRDCGMFMQGVLCGNEKTACWRSYCLDARLGRRIGLEEVSMSRTRRYTPTLGIYLGVVFMYAR